MTLCPHTKCEHHPRNPHHHGTYFKCSHKNGWLKCPTFKDLSGSRTVGAGRWGHGI